MNTLWLGTETGLGNANRGSELPSTLPGQTATKEPGGLSLVRWALVPRLGMVSATADAGVLPLASQKCLDGLAGVAGAAAVDFNAVALEDIERALAHAARQQDGDAFLFKNGGNIGLASAARRREHDPGLLGGLLIAHAEKRELEAMAEVVINGVVGPSGHGNYGVHFFRYSWWW